MSETESCELFTVPYCRLKVIPFHKNFIPLPNSLLVYCLSEFWLGFCLNCWTKWSTKLVSLLVHCNIENVLCSRVLSIHLMMATRMFTKLKFFCDTATTTWFYLIRTKMEAVRAMKIENYLLWYSYIRMSLTRHALSHQLCVMHLKGAYATLY